MSVVVYNEDDGSMFAHDVGVTSLKEGGVAATVTVFLRKDKELRWLRKWAATKRRKSKQLTQEDLCGLLIACVGCGIEAWADANGFGKPLTNHAARLRKECKVTKDGGR